jgi:hypothetical protein
VVKTSKPIEAAPSRTCAFARRDYDGHMDKTALQQLKEAERAVADAEALHGANHPELADALTRYAHLLEADGKKLDAVNVEARAKAIRARIYAKEADNVAQKVSTVVIKPKQAAPVGPGIYLGLMGMLFAVGTLFVSLIHFFWLTALAVVLVVADLVLTRGGGWWRALAAVVCCASAYACIQSVPANMMTDATPMERFNFLSESPALVQNVRALGEPTTVAGYKLALPEDYSKLDQRRIDQGDIYMWQTPPRDDGSQGVFEMMLLKGDTLSPHFSTLSLAHVAQDLAMPHISSELDISEVVTGKPQMEELNGMYYARIEFKGRESERRRAGVAYVAKSRGKMLVLVGSDFVEQSGQTMPQMEAIVYTFAQAHP